MYSIEDVAWYSVVTLRDTALEHHLKGLRKFYPSLSVYTIDNNAGHYDISPIAERYNVKVLVNETTQPLPLTITQDNWSKELFKKHKVLCFSSDDIQIFEGGFIEKSLDLINQGDEIVSFSTNRDAVAYMYTERYFKDVGFEITKPGKEYTGAEFLEAMVMKAYGKFPQVGEYWRWEQDIGCWCSRYVGNPGVGIFGKDNVNEKLRDMGLPY
jgi:hypothetical protein